MSGLGGVAAGANGRSYLERNMIRILIDGNREQTRAIRRKDVYNATLAVIGDQLKHSIKAICQQRSNANWLI